MWNGCLEKRLEGKGKCAACRQEREGKGMEMMVQWSVISDGKLKWAGSSQWEEVGSFHIRCLD